MWKAIRPGRPNEPSLTRLQSGAGRGTRTLAGSGSPPQPTGRGEVLRPKAPETL